MFHRTNTISRMFHAKGPTFWELAVQALSSTEHGYDLLAPKFDYTPFRTPDFILAKVGEHLQTLGPLSTGLDICCGTGAALRFLRPACRDQVVGLDVSAGMLTEARRRTADAPGSSAMQFVRADALRMPFDAAFDVAVCFGAFGHILTKDEPQFVAQIAQVLKPGGRFVFVTAFMPPLYSLGYWLGATRLPPENGRRCVQVHRAVAAVHHVLSLPSSCPKCNICSKKTASASRCATWASIGRGGRCAS